MSIIFICANLSKSVSCFFLKTNCYKIFQVYAVMITRFPSSLNLQTTYINHHPIVIFFFLLNDQKHTYAIYLKLGFDKEDRLLML